MIEILYENKDIVFCIKPIGMSSESDLPDALKNQLNTEIFTLHRLDTPVGGVMIYAKNKAGAAFYSKKISENSDFAKTYLCICEGEFSETDGVMEDLLFKDSRKNKSFVVKRERKGVKKAKLEYKVIGTGKFDDKICSICLVKLYTGRSHQIRVQFSSRLHPLLGDGKYGSKINCPIALYSHKIETDSLSVSHIPKDVKPWNILNIKEILKNEN